MVHRSRRTPVAPAPGQLCLQQVTAGHALPSIGFVAVCPPR
jgi:hypothetical protein